MPRYIVGAALAAAALGAVAAPLAGVARAADATCVFQAAESGELEVRAGQPGAAGGKVLFRGPVKPGTRTEVAVPTGPFTMTFRGEGGKTKTMTVTTAGACGPGRSIGVMTREAEGG